MGLEEDEEDEEREVLRQVVLQGRPAGRPRHELPRRLARAARAAVQLHFPSLPSLKATSESSRIPLAPEHATGLFRSGAPETHIARVLGNTVGLDAPPTTLKLFSAAKNSVHSGLQLSGKHPLGPTTECETTIHGTHVSLLELQLRMVHTLITPHQSDQARPKPSGRIALLTGTDLHSRHRLTMETTFGCEEDKHSLSTVVSSDLHSRLSWGLSSSLNVNEKLVIFSRYNNDAHAGQRVIVQAVSKVDEKNTVSPICATTLGSETQGGLSWTRSFSPKGVSEESIQVKALCSSNGSYMLSVKAQLGEVESLT